MPCRRCGSDRCKEFPAVINIRPPLGKQYLDILPVWAFPKLVICVRCGFTECVLVDAELQLLHRREISGEKFAT